MTQPETSRHGVTVDVLWKVFMLKAIVFLLLCFAATTTISIVSLMRDDYITFAVNALPAVVSLIGMFVLANEVDKKLAGH